jgi:uncharacterized protein YbbC (DUF1343 family)
MNNQASGLKGRVSGIRRRLGLLLVIGGLLFCLFLPAAGQGQVKTGIDVLEESQFEVLRRFDGRLNRIGLVTNQTGVDSASRRTIDVLAHAPGIQLAAIFTPEHGLAGKLDTPQIGNSRDEATGAPVYSVYGASPAQRRPAPEIIKTLDAIVYDLQDVGTRFYTYETTLGYFLEAAAQAGIPIFVLDRPNPASGGPAQGPVSDPHLCVTSSCQFVNYHPLPVRHGMTIGELGKLFNAERRLGAQLTVIAMRGWKRNDWFDATGLAWIDPSPNIRSLTAATLYPGVGLIEATNVSVGRGTEHSFELVGAPWIKARRLASYLNRRAISGIRFLPATFKPTASIFANERCNGVRIVVFDRNALDAPQLGIELASALHKLYRDEYKPGKMLELLANRSVFDAIVAGRNPRDIEQAYRSQTQQFESIKQKYLIY